MPYRHSYGGGLRFMDYDASSSASGGENTLRFPSDGIGGVTETFANSDVNGYQAAVHMIICQTEVTATETQDLTIEDKDGNVFLTCTLQPSNPTATHAFLPVMQYRSTEVDWEGAVANTNNLSMGLEVPGGFGIKIEDASGPTNTAAVRVWYSVV